MAALKQYEGPYQLFNGQRIELKVKGDIMTANEWILVPTSDSTFFSLRDYGEITPVRGTDGRFERFDWNINGQPYTLTPIRN
jgi:hypothetical protein